MLKSRDIDEASCQPVEGGRWEWSVKFERKSVWFTQYSILTQRSPEEIEAAIRSGRERREIDVSTKIPRRRRDAGAMRL